MSITSEDLLGTCLDGKVHLLEPAISYYYAAYPVNHIFQDFSRYVTPARQFLRAVYTEDETIPVLIEASTGYTAFPAVAFNVLDDLHFDFIEKVAQKLRP